MGTECSQYLESPKRALVLGGRGDIGGAIAAHLRNEGIEVFAVGRMDFDLGSPKDIDAYFDKNGNKFDILIHSGGHNQPKLVEDLSDRDIREALDVNLHGFLRVAKMCLPYWKAQNSGHIIVLSSLYGFLARKARLPYVLSKHALNGAVKTLAIEWAAYNILVNSISPGYISTKMTSANNTPETIQGLVAGIPLGRLGTPEDIAEIAAFLCSSRNRYITGQDIVVDGGYSIGGFQQ
jgi:3-oxoacyl-[acyl-carrier protein] reductase